MALRQRGRGTIGRDPVVEGSIRDSVTVRSARLTFPGSSMDAALQRRARRNGRDVLACNFTHVVRL